MVGMKSITRIALFNLLLLTSSFAYADEHMPPSAADALRAYRKTLSRDFDTYHYVTREALKVSVTGELDLSRPELTNHVRDWADYYWNLEQPGGTGMIRGFYLAGDPVISRSFGGDHWLMARVRLTAGLRFLDMTALEHDQKYIPEAVRSRLANYGCDETRWNYLIYKSFKRPCREIALKTLRDLNIDVIQYDWQSGNFAGCANHTEDAYILLRTKWMSSDVTRLFYAEQNPTDREAAFVEAAFARIVQHPNEGEWSGMGEGFKRDYEKRLYPALDSVLSDNDFIRELSARIAGCR